MGALSNQEIIDHIDGIVVANASALKLEIVELKVGFYRSDVLVQLLADRPLGGITIDECTALNQSIAKAIEEAGLINAENFSVEVASPGLDRPLKSYKDFLRNLDYNIRLFLEEPVNGKKEITVLLKQAFEDRLVVQVSTKQEIIIPLSIISRGIVVV